MVEKQDDLRFEMARCCNKLLSNEVAQSLQNLVFDIIPAPVVVLKRSGEIVCFNHVCELLSGYSKLEVVGANIWQLLQPENEHARMQSQLDSIELEQLPISYQNHWLTRNGETLTINWSSNVLLNKDNEIEYIVATGVDITELKRSNERAEMLERIVSAANGHLSFIDTNYIYRAVNKDYLLAHDLENEQIVGMHVADLLGKQIFKEIKPRIERSLNGETISYQAWFDFKGQGRRLMDVSYAPAKDQNGAILGIVVNSRDISDQSSADGERYLAQKVFHNAGDAILITDSRGLIIDVNPAFSEITGYPHDEVIGKNPNFGKSGRHDDAFYKEMWNSLLQNRCWEGEIWDRRKNGEIYPKWLKINAVTDTTGQINHYVGVFSDISERKAEADELQRMAHHDPLTGLPNRTLFYDRLSQAIMQARRDDRRVAVMFIDLDHFKKINDEYGHDIGDQLLCRAAERLSSCVRESDTVARMGGDEFTAILTDVGNSATGKFVANKMLSSMKAPIVIGNIDITISCSIGISIFPDCCATAEELINCADKALYDTKHRGRNGYTIFVDPSESGL
ncbi:MAG: diguanylate cyclase [Gammaproteobacteria bacterium]|nr:diguanylate cyclase [Gammaproteobacteria bacterium]